MNIKRKVFSAIAILLLFTGCKDISDINHIVHMGQSLGAGEHSLPIVTTSLTGYGNLRFEIGTHTWTRKYFENTPWMRDTNNFHFVPLTAVERGHEGETIGNGLCDHLKSTSAEFFSKDFKFLFSYCGQGGRLIRELDKIHDDAKDPRAAERRSSGGYYQTIVDDVKRANQQATNKKLSYSVFAFTWMQGESNRAGHVNRWHEAVADKNIFRRIYVHDLIRLKNDLQQDVTAITGQKNIIPFFTYQTAGAAIGMAQLEACDEDKSIYMVAPTYMMPSALNSRIWGTEEHGDVIHITADAERWLGEMFGKVMRRVIFKEEQWMPLRPLEAYFAGDKKHIRIKFSVPDPPLVLDTVFLPKQDRSLGFEVMSGSRSYPINHVSVKDGEIVELTMKYNLDETAHFTVNYGLVDYIHGISKKIYSTHPKEVLIHGVPNIKIEFEGDITKEFNVAAQEGAFILGNMNTDQKDRTEITVRQVWLGGNGNTILLAEKKDLRNNIPFQKNQTCYIRRGYAYGNLRDSDNEKSTFKFSDKRYGKRYGQNYPLHNWCVVFDDLHVKKRPTQQ